MLYDEQAARYDERVGLPGDAADSVARAIDAIAGLGERTTLLEIGVGTGLVSVALLRYPIHYIAFDRSPAMLEIFRGKVERAGARAELVVADGNDRWPAENNAVDVVFCARALHHIDAGHVVAELGRVLRDGGWLILGKVRRPHDSVKSQMRRRMRALLQERGVDARSHDERTSQVFDALESRGARRLEPVVAARWSVPHRPGDSIRSWQQKDGLGGVEVDGDVKASVLEEVRTWAVERYGDIEGVREQEEFFELYAIEIPKR